MDSVDLKLIASGIFAVICALVTAIYKQPKAYDELVKPVLKWVAVGLLFVGIGFSIGGSVTSATSMTFIPAAQLEEAKKSISYSINNYVWFLLAAAITFVLDVGLYILALKAEKWKNDNE
ncbi:hypothetical protein [Duganella sp. Dugasp56]|uniref:hypothetical protein n=1 Tax=Duganella sp. Dugasp56 TaxID=3243046 RepID=UPI0039B0EED0